MPRGGGSGGDSLQRLTGLDGGKILRHVVGKAVGLLGQGLGRSHAGIVAHSPT